MTLALLRRSILLLHGLVALRLQYGYLVSIPAASQFRSRTGTVIVERPVINETTALGAAYLAGLAVGYWKNQDEIKEQWHMDKRFEPTMEAKTSEELYAGWKKAIEATKAFK